MQKEKVMTNKYIKTEEKKGKLHALTKLEFHVLSDQIPGK